MYTERDFTFCICYNNKTLFISLKNEILALNVGFLSFDNSSTKFSIAHVYNFFINNSKTRFLIFIHQDVKLPKFWLNEVIEQINVVEKTDLRWGALGVFGVRRNGFFSGNICDPHIDQKVGRLPCEVFMLDEVCLIYNKESNLTFDESIGGFHFYGADLCLQLYKIGKKSYAIDAKLTHLSPGYLDDNFFEVYEKFRYKWIKNGLKLAVIETTCGVYLIQNSVYAKTLWFLKKFNRKLIKRLQGRI